ncbi:hypothetical protein CJ030_MR6G028559 [Morella rubra]|uniref:non-specific serine/threonine protein kinase n=1 Tax=Morella rubra TaxID=262757 RepID=A0A6A1VD05_9ROSI|nr:hypothetical protein CJ030_MR6G028559 [Morella rubra]
MGKQEEIMCPIKVKKKSQNQRMPEFATGSWSGLFRGNSKERMNMGDVVTELHSIRRKLLGTNTNRDALPSTSAIPKFLENFKFLQLLNLSYNHFEGEVPTHGVFKNTSATSIKGNSELCGGMPEFQLPKCKYKKSKKRPKLTLTLKLTISALSGLLAIALIVSFLLKKMKSFNLLKATDGFSSTNLIGEGSFGSVYKGILHDHGALLVAVKVINLSHHGASKSFLAECEALRNIRHRNLVKVLTACSGADYQDRDFKALVYEFMVNGNLDEWLHSTPRTNEAPQEQRNLSLIQRMNIAIDVANALEYLHHDCETTIVHCDLKPSNVLLDDEMTARVGDFGLARFLLKQTQDFSTNQSSSIGVRGTMGYAAPEHCEMKLSF